MHFIYIQARRESSLEGLIKNILVNFGSGLLWRLQVPNSMLFIAEKLPDKMKKIGKAKKKLSARMEVKSNVTGEREKKKRLVWHS